MLIAKKEIFKNSTCMIDIPSFEKLPTLPKCSLQILTFQGSVSCVSNLLKGFSIPYCKGIFREANCINYQAYWQSQTKIISSLHRTVEYKFCLKDFLPTFAVVVIVVVAAVVEANKPKNCFFPQLYSDQKNPTNRHNTF